jgi:hypothetical protein
MRLRAPGAAGAAVLLGVCAAVAAVAAAAVHAPPPGATARCTDGTYSFSDTRSGTCSHHGGVAQWLEATAPAGQHVALGHTVLLAPRRRAGGCRRGALPDRRCSPGAYYSALTRTVICARGFRTGTIRDVPQTEKHAVEAEYGMPQRSYGRTIEIDHIVPLELGGSNAVANLFPEPAGPDGYRLKDRLENRLHDLVCAGAVGLHAAQAAIAGNWERLYVRVFGSEP